MAEEQHCKALSIFTSVPQLKGSDLCSYNPGVFFGELFPNSHHKVDIWSATHSFWWSPVFSSSATSRSLVSVLNCVHVYWMNWHKSLSQIFIVPCWRLMTFLQRPHRGWLWHVWMLFGSDSYLSGWTFVRCITVQTTAPSVKQSF